MDGQERSLQVLNIRQIYSSVYEPIAWVGPIEGSPIITAELQKPRNISPPAKTASATEETSGDGSDHFSSFPNLVELFHHRYWMRVWIIQEITVASTVRILYGDQVLLWKDLLKLLSILEVKEAAYKTSHGLPLHLLKFHERYATQLQTPISLFEALKWSLPTQATDSRDKIFALLGLCHDGPTYVPVPNYR
jgi:hypothetical protein